MKMKKTIIGYERILYFVCTECVSKARSLIECHDTDMLTNKKVDVLVASKVATTDKGVVRIASFDESTKHLLVSQSRLQELRNSKEFQEVLVQFFNRFPDIVFYPEFALPSIAAKEVQASEQVDIYSLEGMD